MPRPDLARPAWCVFRADDQTRTCNLRERKPTPLAATAAERRTNGERWRALTSGQRSTSGGFYARIGNISELKQAFDVGERLTLTLPVSFDPVKGVHLIFQLPWRKLSRGCIFFLLRILLNA